MDTKADERSPANDVNEYNGVGNERNISQINVKMLLAVMLT